MHDSVKVGTLQYPRRGQCGCWERTYYADFTPRLSLPYTRVDDANLTRERLDPSEESEVLAILLSVVATGQGHLSWHDVLIEIGNHTLGHIIAHDLPHIRFYEEVSVRKTWNEIHWDRHRVDWSMSAPYFKKGESWKISDKTCKPKVTGLDRKTIDEATASLRPIFPGGYPTLDFKEEITSRIVLDIEEH